MQYLAERFPLTHFLRDATLAQLSAELWPLGVFFLLVMAFATLRFDKHLD